MMLLVSGATRTVRRFVGHQHLGQLMVPASGWSRIPGLPWAMDNGAFTGFDEEAYWKMLQRASTEAGCLFVTAPDVVGDAAATLELFERWESELHGMGLPVAVVAQDGLTPETVPWSRIDALFVGGTTDWKLGHDSQALCQECKRRGFWLHMGRVNTLRRLRSAFRLGCDSVDGSQWSKWSETYIPWALQMLAGAQAQQSLPLAKEAGR